MGIHGIYKEIGPGQRIALSKLAADTFAKHNRPLRLAIDTSIWLFQIQASKGGTNPALRTFYYRLIRLLSLGIHPVFVFDGDNKPPFKRNKRTSVNIASIPEYFAKDLLQWFGFSVHEAPGEAEAECAVLQREGIVDAVLSEDVDTLMFGSGTTIRLWTAEGKGKVPTHVSLYDAEATKNGPAGLDREGMILVALMSGGDYIPEGLPGCGPKVACEAARAGFGKELCSIDRRDKEALKEWRERLVHELRTNQSKFFKRRPRHFDVPDSFPSMEILGYYRQPAVSSRDTLDRLKDGLNRISRCNSSEDLEHYWNTLQEPESRRLCYSLRSFFERPIDFDRLRIFTKDAFKWQYYDDAKHFIRTMYAAALVREIRLNKFHDIGTVIDPKSEEAAIKGLFGSRAHPVTDNCTEIRVECVPQKLVPIDLSKEEVAPEYGRDLPSDDEAELGDEDGTKGRGPNLFNPDTPQRVWILQIFVERGLAALYNDFQNAQRMKAIEKEEKERRQAARKAASTAPIGMTAGPLDRFAKVTKSGQLGSSVRSAKPPTPLPASKTAAAPEKQHAQSEIQAPRTRARTAKRSEAIPATQPARSSEPCQQRPQFREPPRLSSLIETEDGASVFTTGGTWPLSSDDYDGQNAGGHPSSSQPVPFSSSSRPPVRKRSPLTRSETLPAGVGVRSTQPWSRVESNRLDAFSTLVQSSKDDSALEMRSPFRKRRKAAPPRQVSKAPTTPRKGKAVDAIDLSTPTPKRQTAISDFLIHSSPSKAAEGKDTRLRGVSRANDLSPEKNQLRDDADVQRLDLTDSPRRSQRMTRSRAARQDRTIVAVDIHESSVTRLDLTGDSPAPAPRSAISSVESRQSFAELKDGKVPQPRAKAKPEADVRRMEKRQTHVLVRHDGSWTWGTHGIQVEVIDLTTE